MRKGKGGKMIDTSDESTNSFWGKLRKKHASYL